MVLLQWHQFYHQLELERLVLPDHIPQLRLHMAHHLRHQVAAEEEAAGTGQQAGDIRRVIQRAKLETVEFEEMIVLRKIGTETSHSKLHS